MTPTTVVAGSRTAQPASVPGSLEIPAHPEVPDEVRRQVVASHDTLRASEREALEQYSDRLAAVLEQARADRRATLGAGKYQRLREHIVAERHRRAASILPPNGMELSREDRADSAARQRARFSKLLGQQESELRAQNARARDQWERVATADDPVGKVGPIREEGELGKIQVLDHQPNVLHFSPPYDHFGTWTHIKQVKSDDFNFSGFYVDWPADGNLGHVNQLEIWDDVDDFELCTAVLRSLFGFWLEVPPGTKTLNLYAHVEPISTFHAYYLENEFWGNSESHYIQNTSLFSELIGANGGVQAGRVLSQKGASSSGRDDISEGSGQTHFYQDMGNHWFGWSTSLPQLVPPPNGTNVFMWIGVATRNELFVDDVVGLSGVTSRWRFKEILVEPIT